MFTVLIPEHITNCLNFTDVNGDVKKPNIKLKNKHPNDTSDHFFRRFYFNSFFVVVLYLIDPRKKNVLAHYYCSRYVRPKQH